MQVRQNLWGSIEQSSAAPVHCYIPFCVGYKTAHYSEAELLALAKDIETRGYRFTIYLEPKDDTSIEQWKKNNSIISARYHKQIYPISKLRQTIQWQTQLKKLHAILQNPEENKTKKTLPNKIP